MMTMDSFLFIFMKESDLFKTRKTKPSLV